MHGDTWRHHFYTCSCVTATFYLDVLTLTSHLVSPADLSALLSSAQYGLWMYNVRQVCTVSQP